MNTVVFRVVGALALVLLTVLAAGAKGAAGDGAGDSAGDVCACGASPRAGGDLFAG
jgi:hypothetical protein